MPSWRDIFDRFRPVAAPGAPSPVGVPVDRTPSAAKELAAVFALLDETEASCAEIRADAIEAADRIRRAGDAAAEQILAAGRTNAARERAAMAAAARSGAERDRAERVASASREAARIRADGMAALDTHVARAVARVRGLAEGEPAGPRKSASS